MKYFLYCFIIILPALSYSCIETDDCICTHEFVYSTVMVLDSLDQPVKFDSAIVKDKITGDIFDIQDDLAFMPGSYAVMHDGYTGHFSTAPTPILFRGNKGSNFIEAEYEFNTDECKCHIYKVSGPDTLYFNF